MEMSRISFDEIMKEREKAKRNGTYKSSIHSENTQNKGLSFEEVLKEREIAKKNGTYTPEVTVIKEISPEQKKRHETIRAFQTENYLYAPPDPTKTVMETWQEYKSRNPYLLETMEFDTNQGYQNYLEGIRQQTKAKKQAGGHDKAVLEQTSWLQEQRRNLERLKDDGTRKLVKSYFQGITNGDETDQRKAGAKIKEALNNLRAMGYSDEEIDSLADTYKREINAAQSEKMKSKVDKETKNTWGKVKHSFGSVGANLLSGFGVVENVDSYINETLLGKYDPIDTNEMGYYYGDYRDRVRRNITQDIYNAAKDGKVKPANKFLGMTYNAGMSVTDNLTSLALTQLLGLPKGASLVPLSAAATSATSKDVFERTGDSGKALLTGTLAGGIEAATERYSLDHFWDIAKGQGKAATRNMLTNLLVQAGIEGSEEVVAEVSNHYVDRMINGGKSEYDLNVKNYMSNGLSEKEAKKQATRDFGNQVLESFFVGMLAGGMGGSIGNATLAINNQFNGQEAVRTGHIDSVIEEAKTFDDARVKKALEQYEKKPSDHAAGKLIYEMQVTNSIKQNLNESEKMNTENTEVQPGINIADTMQKMSQANTAEELVKLLREVEQNGTQEQIQDARNSYEYQSARMMSEGTVTEEDIRRAEQQLTEEEAFELGKKNEQVEPERLGLKSREAYNNGIQEYAKEQARQNTITDTEMVQKASASDTKGNTLEVYRIETAGTDPMVETNNGTVSLSQVIFNNQAVQMLYNNASTKESAAVANTYINNYPVGMTVNMYDRVFNRFFRAGELGLDFEKELGRNKIIEQYISKKSLEEIYEAAVEKKRVATSQQEGVKRKGTGKVIDERRSKAEDPLMKVYEKLAEKTGQDIVLRDKDMEGINGYFRQSMSEIVMNVDGENNYATLIHEALGEFSEAWNGSEMEQFQTALLEWFYDQNESRMDDVIERYQEVYEKQEGSKSMREAANEMVNDALTGLFGTEEGIKDFSDWLYDNRTQNQAKTILEKISELIQNICDKIKSYLQDTHISSVARETMQMEAKKAAELRKQILDIVDKASENYKTAAEIQKGRDKGKVATESVKYSFAGKRALTSDRSKLEIAKEMYLRGESSENIRHETGWHQGYDGKWRFEIDDSQMEVLDVDSDYVKLDQILKHDQLYKAYPILKKVDVVFQEVDGYGSFNSQFFTINLNSKLKNDKKQLRKTIIHEVQHVIQLEEEFAYGSNTEYWNEKLEESFDSRPINVKKKEKVLREKYLNLKKTNREFVMEMENLDKMTPDVPRGEVNWDTLEQIEDDPIEWQEFDAERERLEEKYGEEAVYDFFDLKYKMDTIKSEGKRNGSDLYYDTAGEIEARETTKRLDYNEADRKKYQPRNKFENLERDNVVFARYSLSVDTEGNKLSQEQMKYFDKSKIRDSNGKLKVFYHGTSRSDRVGYTFRADRATSGPMAFFTDNKEVATKYSKDKGDTSIAYDEKYGNYESQFRVNGKSVTQTWNSMSDGRKRLIEQKAKHIVLDENTGKIKYDESETLGVSDFSIYVNDGNVIKALVDDWLESGKLLGKEEKFLDVLNQVGVRNVEHFNPRVRKEKVYGVYLNITNPLESSQIPSKVVKALKKAAQSAEYTEGKNSDRWDKNNVEPEKWIERLEYDMENGTTYAWTSIPDFVTNTLKSLGYDGILDDSGQHSGDEHNVAIPFYPNQIKETTNQNPSKESGDIRYSLSETSDLDYFWESYDGFDDVIGSSASILEEGAEALKGKEVDTEIVGKIAWKIKKDYASKINRDVLKDNLIKVFSYMQTQEKANYEDMIRVMNEVAMPVIEESTDYNPDELQRYQTFKRNIKGLRIKLSDQQKEEVAYYYGSYENFRKKMFGTLTLVNEGTYLDNLWSEIVGFSEGYLEEDINFLEQPIALAEALEQMKPQLYNNFGVDNQGVAMDLALQIYEDYFKAQADRQVKTLYKKMVHERAVWHDKMRKQYFEKLSEEKKKMREKTGTIQSRVAEIKAAHTASEMEKVKKQREAKFRNSIKKTGADLLKWIEAPTSKNHVPEALKKITLEFLSSIDFISHRALEDSTATKRWQERMRMVQSQLSKAEEAEMLDEYGSFILDLDPDFIPMLDNFLERNDRVEKISMMDHSQLEELNRLITTLKRTIIKTNELHANKQYKHVQDAATNTIQELQKKKDKKQHTKVVEMGDKLLNLDMLDSFTYFEILGQGAKSIQNAIREGFNKRTWHVKEAQDYMQEVLKDVDKKALKKWTGNQAEIHSFKAKDGTVNLTVGQVMSLYCLGKRKQGMQHIMTGGVLASDIWNGRKRIRQTKARHLTQNQFYKIVNSLTPEQKKVADQMQRFLADNCASWGNDTSMILYGYKKFQDTNYFPIKSHSGQTATNDKTTSEASLYAIRNQGMTKTLSKKAVNAIMIEDIMDAFTNHVVGMANYDAFAAPLSDAMKWFNFKNDGMNGEFYEADTVKEEIARVYSKKANDYFVSFIKDINGEVSNATSTEISDMFLSNYKAAAVGANLRVAIQQPTAYMRAALLLNPVDLLGGILRTPNIKVAKNHSAIALWKSWGYYDTHMGQSMKQVITGQYNTWSENVKDKSAILAKLGDEVTWGYLWNACENEVKRKNKGIDTKSEEFWNKVTERFDEVVDQTQVVDTILHRTQFMRSKNSLIKMEAAFMSEPHKSYNMLYRSSKQGGKQFGKAAVVYAFTGMLTSFAAAVVDAIRDDDKEKKISEKYLSNVGDNMKDNLNPLGAIPYVKDIISYMSGFDTERMDMAGISNAINTMDTIYKYINGKGNKTTYGIVKSMAKAGSQITGIPAYNAMRDIEAMFETMTSVKVFESNPTKAEMYRSLLKYGQEGEQKKYDKLYDTLLEEVQNEEELQRNVRKQIKKMHQEREIDWDETIELLVEYGLSEDEAYWEINKWNGGEDYTKYQEFYRAIDEQSNDLEDVIDMYLDHGVTAETLSGRITAQYKEQYIELYRTDKKAAKKLKRKLLDVYDELGYNRAKKEKTIDKWIE